MSSHGKSEEWSVCYVSFLPNEIILLAQINRTGGNFYQETTEKYPSNKKLK